MLGWSRRNGQLPARAGFTFGHGAEFSLPGGLTVISSYHPSLQNTNIGKLTRPMFLEIFKRARTVAGLG
jgi:uracil-DNA glycosylase